MAARKAALHPVTEHPELDVLLEEARRTGVSDEQLQEQRVSFAFGNAPADAENVTKESVRAASTRNRLAMA